MAKCGTDSAQGGRDEAWGARTFLHCDWLPVRGVGERKDGAAGAGQQGQGSKVRAAEAVEVCGIYFYFYRCTLDGHNTSTLYNRFQHCTI